MRKVIISKSVLDKIVELRVYLTDELRLSMKAAINRTERMRTFLKSLSGPADYPLCRFKHWLMLGYRCVVFEKTWVFAYEVVPEGVIVRDMSHTSVLVE